MKRVNTSIVIVSLSILFGWMMHWPGGAAAMAAEQVEVSVATPQIAQVNTTFIAEVRISDVLYLDACNYDISYDASILQVTNVTAGQIGGQSIPVDIWSEVSAGTVRVVQNVPGIAGVSGSGYLAQIHFKALAAGSTQVTLSKGVIGNATAQNITAAWGGTTVVVSAIVAETDMGQEAGSDKVALIPVNVVRAKDPSTGQTMDIAGGIRSYQAKVEFDAAGIQMLDVRGAGLFASPAEDLSLSGQAVFSASHAEATGPSVGTVAYLVPRLVGSATASHNLTLTFQNIADAGGTSIPQESPVVQTYLRGDAKVDGAVTIADALFIAQYLALSRPLSYLNPVNAASVRWDDGGDKITITDALFIAQYKSLIRDDKYNMK